MIEIGYTLSSEDDGPRTLVEGFFRFFERELGPRLQRAGLEEAA